MPLKILLADDSMTAQKMGKEILIGAGYEVIAVSNGAAAAKKLAEKPDICVLDIIMPGYTGIEVCEKIRASIETAKMPVLLTVGKMEHFEQKDVQRVAADGVIVKPFEATDLLATIQKFAERLAAPAKAAAAAAGREKTIAFTPPNVEEFKDDSYNQWKTEATFHDDATGEMPASKKAMEIPADVAAAPAFMDADPAETVAAAPELGGTSRDKTVLTTPPNFMAAITAAVAAAPAVEPATPSFDMSASPAFDMTPAAFESAPPVIESFAAPAVQEAPSVAPADAHALEFTAQPAVDVSVPMESGFQATAHDAVEVPHVTDNALVTGTEGFDSFKTTIGETAPAAAPAAEEDDFDARVAKAMAELEEPAPPQEAVAEVAPEPEYQRTQKFSVPPELLQEPERVTQTVEVPAIAEATQVMPAPFADATQVMEAPFAEATQVMPAPFAEATQAIPSPYAETAPAMESSFADTQIMSAPVVEEAQLVPATPGDAQAVPDGMVDAALVEQMQAAVAHLPVETAPIEDTQEITAPVVEAQTIVADAPKADMELAKALAAAVGAEAPIAASSDHPEEVHQIAHTVTRVFERMLPDIMEEVKRELAKRQKK